MEIKVENHSDEDVVVNVKDRIPKSTHEDVKITLVKESIKADKIYKDGRRIWAVAVDQGETVTLTFTYQVKMPEKFEIRE